VQSPEVEAAAEVVELVRRGLPPPALAAFLEGARLVPRIEYAGVLGDLLRYRRAEIRGRALAALTSIGGASATQALLRALDDPERRVRRLAVVLSSGSSAPEVLRVRAALQEREPDLFEEDDDLVVSDEPETPAAETPAP
jgi:HEAT repeat protein